MSLNKYFFTSESVTEGHPDKLADQISDAVLDSILEKDPNGRVACETMLTTGLCLVAGEISTNCYVEVPKIVRETIREVGYTKAEYGMDYLTCGVLTAIQEQSPDISQGVDTGGAGDQGMMFGFAVNESPEFMPLSISLAHKLSRRLAEVRKDGIISYLRPDGKSQVTIEYEDGKPLRVDTILIAAQHDPGVRYEQIKEDIIRIVVGATVPASLMDKNTKIYVNQTGSFIIGGPQADTGLTGRKIIVDTYGGAARHGGGCFSGKDPTKVDRSAAYMVRYVAKNIVAAGIADKCEIQVSYAIGKAEPLSVMVYTFGTGKISDENILKIINDHFDLRPRSIIDTLNLLQPIYKKVAVYGHFGRVDLDIPWERTDKAEELKSAAGLGKSKDQPQKKTKEVLLAKDSGLEAQASLQ